MNIKQFIIAASLTLFSSQALSEGVFYLNISGFFIDEIAQKNLQVHF